jgi:hypothetical protein
MNQPTKVYFYLIDAYVIKSETKCFYVLQKCCERNIIKLNCDTTITKFELVDYFVKVKKEALKDCDSIKLDIDTDYIIYSSDSLGLPKKLKPKTDKNILIMNLLNDSRYPKIFKLWNLSANFDNLNKTEKTEFKLLKDEFRPYCEDIFKYTNYKL